MKNYIVSTSNNRWKLHDGLTRKHIRYLTEKEAQELIKKGTQVHYY